MAFTYVLGLMILKMPVRLNNLEFCSVPAQFTGVAPVIHVKETNAD